MYNITSASKNAPKGHIYRLGQKSRIIRTKMPFRVWRWAGAMARARHDKALGSVVALARRCSYFCPNREERATAAPWRALARRYVSAMALARRQKCPERATVIFLRVRHFQPQKRFFTQKFIFKISQKYLYI